VARPALNRPSKRLVVAERAVVSVIRATLARITVGRVLDRLKTRRRQPVKRSDLLRVAITPPTIELGDYSINPSNGDEALA